MGVAYYPELNPAIADYQPELLVGGNAIARAAPLLEIWATEIAVHSLFDFYSESNEEAFGKIGEPVPPGMKDEPIEWADPNDGITTIRALLERLRGEPGPEVHFKDKRALDQMVSAKSLERDLEGFESVLKKASEHGSKFRLRIDI